MRTSDPCSAPSRRPGQYFRRLAATALLIIFSSPVQSQTAILQVRILEGDGAVHAAGSRPARVLLIEVTDETGTPVSGAIASFRLPDEGATGLFANGLRTDLDVTDVQGHASLRGLQFNHTDGEFQIRITVAKDDARAGTVSTQFINESKNTNLTKQSQFRSPAAGGGYGRKLLIIGIVAAAAAGGGVAALSRGSGSSKPISTPAPSILTIGAPTISVGKP
ncbi:MAG: hypothetical protein M3Y07_18085 [Acidobacteriota bacterium]|nr:hypothetical protein [Acidobacteriota bacterium]